MKCGTNRRGWLVASVALVATLLVSGAQLAQAGSKGAEVEGTLSAIDVAGLKITITNKAGVATVAVVNAATKIERNGKKATIDSLVVGERAEAKLDATGIALKLEVKSASAAPPAGGATKPKEVEGTLSAVDLIAKTATIKTKAGTEVVVTVLDTTKIERNDKKATLDQLIVGEKAEAKFDAAGNASKLETKTRP